MSMALEQRLVLKQTLQLRMTPQLRMAIKILQLARPELETMVADELCQNPVLEEVEGSPSETAATESRTADPEKTEAEPAEVETATHEKDGGDLTQIDWQEYLERSGSDFHGAVGAGSDRDDSRARLFENAQAPDGGLTAALIDQLGLLMMSEDERRIATLIVHDLDEDGYLACAPEDIAFIASCTLEDAHEAREIVQELEPPGCGSIDLRDCLLVQLRLLGYEPDDYVVLTVDAHLKDLESQRYDKIAKTLSADVEEIIEAHRIIRSLDPKPGSTMNGGDPRYIAPDVYIVRIGDNFEVVLNDDGLPNLQVSHYYKDMLKGGVPEAGAKTYLSDKVRAAVWLIRSIEQRQRTLRKVTESILRFQYDFFVNGVESLKPMVLKDVAYDIGMHESTVSRATSSKYVHTPQGLFELKYFFTSSLRGTDGSDISSETVKQKILTIIGTESPRKPFSDQYICDQLGKDNVDIARRTVAKYRESLGVLPSSKRKRLVSLD